MPKKAIWRKIIDGPENEGWALGKRAIRDIYLKMRNHELFAKDKSHLTKNLQRLGVSDTLLGKKPKKRKEDKRKRKIVPSGAKAKKQKTRPKKSEAVKRKEIRTRPCHISFEFIFLCLRSVAEFESEAFGEACGECNEEVGTSGRCKSDARKGNIASVDKHDQEAFCDKEISGEAKNESN